MLENITLNNEPLINYIVRNEADEAFKESSKKRARNCIKTKSSFYKPGKKSEVKCIMMSHNRLPEAIDFISRSQEEFSISGLAKALNVSKSSASRYTRFLKKEGDLSCYKAGKELRFIPRKINVLHALEKWAQTAHKEHQVRKEKKTQENTTKAPSKKHYSVIELTDKAILMHAQWGITKVPWHAEQKDVKALFIQLSSFNIDQDMLNIILEIQKRILVPLT
jgi:hypothetical protein